MESARSFGIATVGEAGEIRIRTMDPFLPDPDWSVWLGTNQQSRKIADIQRNPQVTLYYFSSETMGHVSISGTARVVNDPQEKSKRRSGIDITRTGTPTTSSSRWFRIDWRFSPIIVGFSTILPRDRLRQWSFLGVGPDRGVGADQVRIHDRPMDPP
jgi:hypothetical protein